MSGHSGFDPILCFARDESQTPDEVFDMLQERMMTLLGKTYSDKGVGSFRWVPDGVASQDELAAIADWQASSMILATEDFDRLGGKFGLSMADVLGRPRIPKAYQDAVRRKVRIKGSCLDPVVSFVTLAAFDQIDEMARQRKDMAASHKGDRG